MNNKKQVSASASRTKPEIILNAWTPRGPDERVGHTLRLSPAEVYALIDDLKESLSKIYDRERRA